MEVGRVDLKYVRFERDVTAWNKAVSGYATQSGQEGRDL